MILRGRLEGKPLDSPPCFHDKARVQSAPTETPVRTPALPRDFFLALRRHGIRPSRFVLAAGVTTQRMALFERSACGGRYGFRRTFLISTSRFGIGQVEGSNGTPLGLHRIAEKIGGGHPIGTVFKARRPVGFTWQGMPDGAIAHRVLWLEGVEPGLNRGGNVDSFRRYVYIHGCGDETTLGRPMSRGCIHLAAADLMPLYEMAPAGTLVWISER
jgi:hypothetical protein